MEKIKKHLPDICTVLIVTLMVICAELTGEKEIIFPEITALAIGYLVAPKRSWMVNGIRMIILITGCAILGVLIVRYLPFDIIPQLIIAFTFAQILFMFSGTTFAPFVSAIVLPVMLGTTSFIYPIAAFLLTFIIVIFHNIFKKMGIIEDEAYIPVKLTSKQDILDTVIRILIVSVIIFASVKLDFKYIVAPPLLVAFTELSRPRNKTRNKPIKVVCIITACAIAGATCRYVFDIILNLPITFAAVLITIIVLIIVHSFKMYMPPAGAIAILSILIPKESVLLFPVQILIGSLLFVFISRLLFMRRQEKKDHELFTS